MGILPSDPVRDHYLDRVRRELRIAAHPSVRDGLTELESWISSDLWAALEQRLMRDGIPIEIQNLLLLGVLAREIPDSPLDDTVLALRRARWTPEQIMKLLAIVPLWHEARRLEGWSERLTESVREADARLARARRPGENFDLLSVVRSGTNGRATWELTIRADGEETDRVLRLTTAGLCSEIRFRQRCLESLDFLPVLRRDWSGDYYQRFLSLVASLAGEIPLDEASDLLARVARDLTAESRDNWIGTPTELWQAVTRRAEQLGTLPLRWPRSPDALAWAMKRATPELRAAGLEWSRGRQHGPEGGRRTMALRVRKAPKEAPRTG